MCDVLVTPGVTHCLAWTDEVGRSAVEWLDWMGGRLGEWSSSMDTRHEPEPTSDGTDSLADAAGLHAEHAPTPSHSMGAKGLTGSDHHFMELTRRLLEIKNILRAVGHADALHLPSLVVVGSQSSGKSSLLESIVGHQFLPKGNNMVTRRPIEITLIHTPDSHEEYAELPSQGLYRIRDFHQVQSVLTDMNLAVSDEECVSRDPIDLRIYSPHVPDLNLIDLPGYIALHNRNQPAVLKDKIRDVCSAYLKEPNIILAVSAADVDLANSEALNEAHKADPLGVRTVGILTKMDLVPADRAVKLIRNDQYPLQFGYWGVVCRSAVTQLASNAADPSSDGSSAEDDYFRQHAHHFGDVADHLGVAALRKTLIRILESQMSRSMQSIMGTVQVELEESRYQFKVQFNDRSVSPESYAAEVIGEIRNRFRHLASQHDRTFVRNAIRALLDRRVTDLCTNLYWSDERVTEFAAQGAWTEEQWRYWSMIVDRAHALFTKSGLGRQTTQAIVEDLSSKLQGLLVGEPFTHHPETVKKTLELASGILKSRLYHTVDQVENSIKPFKFDVEFSSQEWEEGVVRVRQLLEQEIKVAKKRFDEIKTLLGRRKLRSTFEYFEVSERAPPASFTAGTSAPKPLPEPVSPKAKVIAMEAWRLQKRMNVLEARLEALRPGWFGMTASPCSTAYAFYAKADMKVPPFSQSGNQATAVDPVKRCQVVCPEPYLAVMSDKLAQQAMMFVWVELLHEFYYLFPRELDQKIHQPLCQDRSVTATFASENPTVKNHLQLQTRKVALEAAMERLNALRSLNTS